MTLGGVVVIGDALVDEVDVGGVTTRHAGGSALNVAIGLAVLGRPASLIASLGDDEQGGIVRGVLAEHGVSLVATRNALGTGVARSERIAGEPHYVFSAAAIARPLDFDERQLREIAGAAVIAISGFPFDSIEMTDRLLAALERLSAIVAVDPNPRAGLMTDAAAYGEGFRRIAAVSDLVKLGSEDIALLEASAGGASVGGPRPGGMLLMTEGARGASVWIDDARVAAAPTFASPDGVVDTMGAGDATFATFVSALARDGRGLDVTATLEQAMRVAAATVAMPGALLRRPGLDGPRT